MSHSNEQFRPKIERPVSLESLEVERSGELFEQIFPAALGAAEMSNSAEEIA